MGPQFSVLCATMYIFCTNTQLKAHSDSVHGDEEYTCDTICQKKFTRKFRLTSHIKNRVKSFCDLCGLELCLMRDISFGILYSFIKLKATRDRESRNN